MLLLFDIDGTILLSGGAGTRALEGLFFERYGIERAMDGVRPAGNTDPLILRDILERRLGRAPRRGEIEELLEAYVPRLRRELRDSPGFHLMPKVVEALDAVERLDGAILGIATGNVREAARAKLERAGLWERFSLGGFGCDHADRARLVARAIERARAASGRALPGEEVYVIGDTSRDVAAARACGTRAVAVATGVRGRDGLAESRPDVLLDDLGGLAAWLAGRVAPNLAK